ncbi:MAG: aspartyl protease family protein [Verrucomicrobiota bacterium JB023]|nr:aspartyl protease family protein [Verrucomicrobiota bacterium JB023]
MKAKAIIAVGCLVLAGWSSAQTDGLESEYRSFTGSNGKVIEAVLLRKSEDGVTLLLRNGRRADVPLERLSEADQKYISGWNEEEAIFLRECQGLTVRQLLELRGYESMKFEFKSNSIIIDGVINGMEAEFLVDTGAHNTILHVDSAKRADLEVGPMTETIYGVAGETQAGWTPVPTILFGESGFKDIQLLAADLAEDRSEEERKESEDVLLGADLLSQLETVIDYKDRRIFFRPDLSDENQVGEIDFASEDDGKNLTFRIFKKKDGSTLRGKVVDKGPHVVTLELIDGSELKVPISSLSAEDATYIFDWSEEAATFLAHCRSLTVEELLDLRAYQSFQYERRGNHIYVDGTMNKHDVTFLIDTGADSSLLHLHWAKEYDCDIGPMDQWVYGIGGKAPAAAAKVAEITLGNAILSNRVILTTDLARADLGRADEDVDYVGLFGADYMRELEAVITYRENRIFLKPTK